MCVNIVNYTVYVYIHCTYILLYRIFINVTHVRSILHIVNMIPYYKHDNNHCNIMIIVTFLYVLKEYRFTLHRSIRFHRALITGSIL